MFLFVLFFQLIKREKLFPGHAMFSLFLFFDFFVLKLNSLNISLSTQGTLYEEITPANSTLKKKKNSSALKLTFLVNNL